MGRFVVDVRREVVQYEKGRFTVEAVDARAAVRVANDELVRGEVLDTVEWATIDMDFKAARVEGIIPARDPPTPEERQWATS